MLRIGIVGLAIAAGLFAPRSIDAAASAARHTTTAAAATAERTAASFSRENFSSEELGTIDVDVFELALNAASCAVKSGAVGHPRTLTVIDYSKPSTEQRLWVYDLNTRELVYQELVAHGQGTGANVAAKFSNQPDSHQTSLGLFVTDETYVGRNGYSLRLDGLDKGWNDRARERAIVMHGAPYVSPAFVKANGRLGRSHGCPAVSDTVARQLIDRVKGGGLVFAYYPDPQFLKTSKYLRGCS
ncbi:MAG TPA: murein L,D-transpeptidase catalytic domain family protein [Vicinamibacterales bacterium]|nr:murein L,D-transpeptidase catalytic domain family protein [Vicinamibacterales bacterium]